MKSTLCRAYLNVFDANLDSTFALGLRHFIAKDFTAGYSFSIPDIVDICINYSDINRHIYLIKPNITPAIIEKLNSVCKSNCCCPLVCETYPFYPALL